MADETVSAVDQQKIDAAMANDNKRQMIKYVVIASISAIVIWFAYKSFK